MRDLETKLSEIKREIRQFVDEREWDRFHTPKDLAIGMSTEANELLALFRFKSDEEQYQLLNEERSRKAIADELADVFYFVARFSEKFGIDLSQALTAKMAENRQRYPIEKSKGKNLKYNEL